MQKNFKRFSMWIGIQKSGNNPHAAIEISNVRYIVGIH